MPHTFNFNHVDPSWHACIKEALSKVDPTYLNKLYQHTDWLPGANNIFNAFSIPVTQVNYVLFGESPYPREHSANGYAFWDAAVTDIWSEKGLSKAVNRATSLRNIMKMLLVSEGLLKPEKTSQEDIAMLDKKRLVRTNHEFFYNLLNHGFLLLNASLVLQSTPVKKDANAWQPFIHHILHFILKKNPSITLILFGQIANTIDKLIDYPNITKLYAEHPYNLSFVNNKNVLDFFRPLHLLKGNNNEILNFSGKN